MKLNKFERPAIAFLLSAIFFPPIASAADKEAQMIPSTVIHAVGSLYDDAVIIAAFDVSVSKDRPTDFVMQNGYGLNFSLDSRNNVFVSVMNPHALISTKKANRVMQNPSMRNPKEFVEIPIRIQICGKYVTIADTSSKPGC